VQELIASLSDALACLLPDFGKQLAIDSTIVLAYPNPNKQTKVGGLNDPEASWTTKSYKRCVAANCHLQGEEGTPYCEYVITVQPGDDLRKIGPVARVPTQWKKLFSRRSAVERVNSRLKETRRLQDFCFRRLRKATAHCLLSVLTLQASAVAQARMGGLVGVRQCLRKVA
jgi:hypothetical protein